MGVKLDLSQAEKIYQKYYDRLISEALHARAHLNLWERIEKYKSTGYVDELNQARYFFSFTSKAHLENALATLSRILVKDKSSLSIWRFLDFAEQNLEIYSTEAFKQRKELEPDYDKYWESKIKSHEPLTLREINEDRQKLESAKQVVNNLTIWRHKLIAHIDPQVILTNKSIAKEYPLQLQQLKEATGTIFNILDRYSGAFDSSSYAEDYPGEDDIQFVMDCIRFYIEEHHRQIEAKLEALKKSK